MLSPQVPALVSYLEDQSLTEAILGALMDVSQASPSSLVSFLPVLRIMGQQCPAFLGHVAKIHGAVGIINEVQMKVYICLQQQFSFYTENGSMCFCCTLGMFRLKGS